MTARGLEMLRKRGGDGFIGGGSLFGAADGEFLGSTTGAATTPRARSTRRRNEALFPKLWLPGGWAGVHGAYQSELKAIMAMLGQPGGAAGGRGCRSSTRPRSAEIRKATASATAARWLRAAREEGTPCSQGSITSASEWPTWRRHWSSSVRGWASAEVLFDHTGDLPGLEELTHRSRTRARVVMLASRNLTQLGPGKIKLVQVLEDGGTPPMAPGAC